MAPHTATQQLIVASAADRGAGAGTARPEGDKLIHVRVPTNRQRRGHRGQRMAAIELCCGHAGLTAALWDHGLEAAGVDWARNKHQPSVPILNVDLTTEQGQAFIMKMISEEHVVFIHMGPPCGTFMRARERPIPAWQRKQGAPCPQPLRSDERPEGLPWWELSELDRIKVHKGNVIGGFCATVAQYCLDHDKTFSIENPTNSLLWKLPCYQQLRADPRIHICKFDACMWGSKRDKKTAFVTNLPELQVLRKDCDGKH